MHETLHPSVKGYVDECKKENGTLYIRGWCFHEKGVFLLRVSGSECIQEIRQDVCDFYKNTYTTCGWSVINNESTEKNELMLEMKIEDVWVPILQLKFTIEFGNSPPSFVVVDNFYKNPDMIRNFALRQNFVENPKYHKGKRAIDPSFRFPELKTQFETILGKTITNWNTYEVNGCFQYCIAEDKAVYHCDMQTYAGIIYLTPDAPPQAGTSFYRSKQTKKMKLEEDADIVFRTGNYDSTQFELVDTVGNLYNRLILFDAKMFHAAPVYFGNQLKNGRLFQLFFFDLA